MDKNKTEINFYSEFVDNGSKTVDNVDNSVDNCGKCGKVLVEF